MELVVEHEQALEASVNAERERIKHDLESYEKSLGETHAVRIAARTNLYERQRAALVEECEERLRSNTQRALDDAKRLAISEDDLVRLTEHVLEGSEWPPKSSTR